MKFKVGDKVRIISKSVYSEYWSNVEREIKNLTGIIEEIRGGGIIIVYGFMFLEQDLELISSDESNKQENKNMNLKEKFALAFTKEPQKSFRKEGITNGDDFLTEDGQKVFLSYLLKKFGDDFKKDVVDEIIKDEEN